MNRRGFVQALVAAAVLDPERLLWVPGKKLISIPRERPSHYYYERCWAEVTGKRLTGGHLCTDCKRDLQRLGARLFQTTRWSGT